MNQQNARDYIPLIEALADGELQVYHLTGEWCDIKEVQFQHGPERYRRKPKSVKLYVATWFDTVNNPHIATSMTKEGACRWAGEKGFKIHELDCGVAE